VKSMKGKLFLLMVALLGCAGPDGEADSQARKQLQAFLQDFSPGPGRSGKSAKDELSKESLQRASDKTIDQLKQLHKIDSSQLNGDDLIDGNLPTACLPAAN